MQKDKQIFDLIDVEKKRQVEGIELIASENFTSEQVMSLQDLYLQINMLKVTLEKDIMVVVKLLMKLRP